MKLSSGSYLGFRTLYELNICIILKDILAIYDVPHGVSSPRLADGHCIQVVWHFQHCCCYFYNFTGFLPKVPLPVPLLSLLTLITRLRPK